MGLLCSRRSKSLLTNGYLGVFPSHKTCFSWIAKSVPGIKNKKLGSATGQIKHIPIPTSLVKEGGSCNYHSVQLFFNISIVSGYSVS